MRFQRVLSLAVLFGLLPCSVFLPAARAVDKGWPKGYELAEKSESPNGRFGVLLPTIDQAGEDEDKTINTLVDLKTHHRLGTIDGAHFYLGQNHRGLSVAWATDSSWCAVTYEARFGFGAITLVEPHGTKCTQTDLGRHIQEALDGALARQAHDKAESGCGTAYFRSGPKSVVLVRATANTNPKSMEGQPTYYALFQGTFDRATGEWTRSEARKIPSEDPFPTAYDDTLLDERVTFSTEEDRLAWYDARLNEVYEVVRMVLPAERFAAVKKEQIAWLKQLEARDSVAAKCKFIGVRINALRQLVW